MIRFKEYLHEAVLSQNTTAGGTSWEKYIINNPKALELTLRIENKMKNVPVFDEAGNIVSYLNAGDEFKLLDKNLYDVEGKQAARTNLGFVHLNKIRKPTRVMVLAAEQAATSELDRLIRVAVAENDGVGITINVGRHKIKDCVSASSDHIKRDPKADIAIFDSNGREVGFISHKKEGGALGFQQYGGVSKASGMFHREIDSYLEDLGKFVEERNNGKSVARSGLPATYRIIKDEKLIKMSVFGPEAGKAFSRDNVHCIGQGKPILIRRGNGSVYELTFSETMHANGDISWARTGEYTACFVSTFRNGRMFHTKKGSYRNVRVGIYPIAMIRTRRNVQEI